MIDNDEYDYSDYWASNSEDFEMWEAMEEEMNESAPYENLIGVVDMGVEIRDDGRCVQHEAWYFEDGHEELHEILIIDDDWTAEDLADFAEFGDPNDDT